MKLAIVAGEASGDLHASEVVRELRELDPGWRCSASAGTCWRARGCAPPPRARDGHRRPLQRAASSADVPARVQGADRADREEKPDVVFLVDYPEFNLRVAKRCQELGIQVVYYISPQLWAWRQGSVRHIARYVDRMIVIFPFEEEFYRKHDVPVTYVGHPLIEQLEHVAQARAQGRTRCASRCCRIAADGSALAAAGDARRGARSCARSGRSTRTSSRRRRSRATRSKRSSRRAA